MAKGISIAERVEALVEPCITELGYRIWDVEYVKEGTEWYLRITLDSDDGFSPPIVRSKNYLHFAALFFFQKARNISQSAAQILCSPAFI